MRIVGVLVAALVLGVLATPGAARGQPKGDAARVGFLTGNAGAAFVEAFRQGLRDLGWSEGRVVVEHRVGEGDGIPQVAAELVRLRVDVMVLTATAIHRARDVTGTVPLVFVIADDPVKAGYAASLARPGGRMTGLTSLNIDLDAKRLEILKQALPGVARVGILASRQDPVYRQRIQVAEQAARALGLQLQVFEVSTAQQLGDAFDQSVRSRVGAMMVPGAPVFLNHQARIVELATKARLPVVSAWREFPSAGGLISYGTNVSAMFRRAASYVDRILKGASPGDLPIEQASTFELVINLKTAKTLGLSMPTELLARADRLIE